MKELVERWAGWKYVLKRILYLYRPPRFKGARSAPEVPDRVLLTKMQRHCTCYLYSSYVSPV